MNNLDIQNKIKPFSANFQNPNRGGGGVSSIYYLKLLFKFFCKKYNFFCEKRGATLSICKFERKKLLLEKKGGRDGPEFQ